MISFNTFAGTFAFGAIAANKGDGILITSSGGNNLIRTCIVSGNHRNGIELGGNATGVQVTDTTAGLEVTNDGILEIPNLGSGIKIDGQAHHNAIGGFQPSVEPQVTISDNDRYGIEVVGSAHDNLIVHTYIGTNYPGKGDLGNQLGGIYLGRGFVKDDDRRRVRRNAEYHPRQRRNWRDDAIVQPQHVAWHSNHEQHWQRCVDHWFPQSDRRFEHSGTGNQFLSNEGFGLQALGVCTGTVVQSNLIAANSEGNVDLTKSRGVTVMP